MFKAEYVCKPIYLVYGGFTLTGQTRRTRLKEHKSLTTTRKSSPWFEKKCPQLWRAADKVPGNVGGTKQELSLFTWRLPFDSFHLSSSRGSVKCECANQGHFQVLKQTWVSSLLLSSQICHLGEWPRLSVGGKLPTATQRTQRSQTTI